MGCVIAGLGLQVDLCGFFQVMAKINVDLMARHELYQPADPVLM